LHPFGAGFVLKRLKRDAHRNAIGLKQTAVTVANSEPPVEKGV
jgi:hypothetical protein